MYMYICVISKSELTIWYIDFVAIYTMIGKNQTKSRYILDIHYIDIIYCYTWSYRNVNTRKAQYQDIHIGIDTDIDIGVYIYIYGLYHQPVYQG